MHIIYLIFYLSVCLSLDKLSESRSIRVSSDDLMCVYLCLFKMKTEWNIGENQQQQQPYCKQNNQSQASQLDSRTPYRGSKTLLFQLNSTKLPTHFLPFFLLPSLSLYMSERSRRRSGSSSSRIAQRTRFHGGINQNSTPSSLHTVSFGLFTWSPHTHAATQSPTPTSRRHNDKKLSSSSSLFLHFTLTLYDDCWVNYKGKVSESVCVCCLCCGRTEKLHFSIIVISIVPCKYHITSKTVTFLGNRQINTYN